MDCTWDNPGADRYTGTVAAAVAAYGLPVPTQKALVEAWEKRQFTDHIIIDRESIRGQHEYDSDIRSMHFGSKGRICGTVTRAKWSDKHTEAALVVCAAGECIAVPAVCLNVFRLTPKPRGDRSPEPAVGRFSVEPVEPLPALVEPPPIAFAPGVPDFDQQPAYGSPIGTYTWALYSPPPITVTYRPDPISPIPEPRTYLLMALGLAGIAWVVSRQRKE